MSFDPVERIRIDITADGGLDLTGNTSRPFPMGLDWVRAEDYDQLLALHNRVLALYRELRDGIDFLHETRTAQAAPHETGLPTIEEMCGFLDVHRQNV